MSGMVSEWAPRSPGLSFRWRTRLDQLHQAICPWYAAYRCTNDTRIRMGTTKTYFGRYDECRLLQGVGVISEVRSIGVV